MSNLDFPWKVASWQKQNWIIFFHTVHDLKSMPLFKEGLDWTLFETSIDVIVLEFLVIQSEDNRERNLGWRAGF